MYITTANHLNDIKIIETYNPISVSLIVGTNIFSDISSSFIDFFGGRAESYENKLNKLFDDAKTNLIKQINELGGNGLIGFTAEYNEISGKEKSMLMISVYGTPIKMEKSSVKNFNDTHIDFKTFENKLKAARLLMKYEIKESLSISTKDLNFIISSRLTDFEGFIKNLILLNKVITDGLNSLDRDVIFNYYYGFEPSVAKEMLYRGLTNAISIKNSAVTSAYLNKIIEMKLIDYNQLLQLIQISTIEVKLYYYELAICNRESFSKDDIIALESIRDSFLKIKPEFDHEIIIKKSVFVSDEMWVCKKCQNPNYLSNTSCSKCQTGKIKFPTLNYSAEYYLAEMDLKINVLKDIFMV